MLATAGLLLVPLRTTAESPAPTPTGATRDWTPVAQTQARNIPTPERYFGFRMGTTGKLAGFPKIKDYLRLIDRNSDRVTYQVAGTTTDGNEYPVLFVSSPGNLRKLDRIVEMNRRLSDPRGLSPEQARALAAQSVPVYMLEATLHSTEVSNTQAVVDIVHRFATEDSDYTRNVLDNVVIMVIPSGNPDGQHRVVDYFNRTAGTDLNRVYPDLYQKYVGHDNNRDWFMFSQPETRIRTNLEKKYRPVVFHAGHQAGTGSPRIWLPTYDEPLSRDIDPITIESANSLGAQVGRALIAEGKKGVQHDDAYGIFFNADVAGYSSYRGTSLFLHEIASARDLAYPFRSADGRPLGPQDRTMRNVAPYDSDTWTLEQMVDYAKTSYYTGLKTVADNARTWLFNNLYQVARNSLSWTGGPRAYVIPAAQRDPYATFELLDILEFGEVEIHRATKAFTANDQRYDAGSYVIWTQQPLGRWADQLLKIEDYPINARKCARCPLIMPYSETTDNLGLLLGVDVDAVPDTFTAKLERVSRIDPARVTMPATPRASGAYLVSPNSYAVGKVLAALQAADVPVFRSEGTFTASGRTFAAGTVIVPPSTQARTVLARVSAETGVPVFATDTTPRVKGFQLKPNTRVGLIRGANNMPGGWLMWMFDQYGVNYQVVGADDYTGGGLTSRYDTIVIADGVTRQRIVTGIDPARHPADFAWARGVGEAGWAQLRAFVQGGGNLVAIGDGADTARELLDLPVRNVVPSNRDDFNVPGALVHNTFDPAVPAAWGMPEQWPVWYYNNSAYQVTSGAGARVAAGYPRQGELLASGYAHGQQTLAGLANVVSFDVGRGHVTIAGSEITFRSWPRSASPLLYNSIYHGPSQPTDVPRFN
ncbi:M14 family metallopeptidase [Micromonospora sonneratiae]|uniref:M14 family zinc carboxypeptidase n=1 Tax=Micromonospora sonneratiae TaxID=1184706 RepID=UPI003672E6B6